MNSKINLQRMFQKGASKIQNNRYINAITNALMSLLPVTIVGSIGSLINALPLDFYQNFLVDSGLKTVTSIPNEITNNLLALYAVYLIAVRFAQSYDYDGVHAGLLALMSFLIVTPLGLGDAGSMEFLPTLWLGAPGLFSAFIIALVVAKIYVIFQNKGWVIKMPAGVPLTVAKSFSGLVPSLVVMVLMLAIRFVLSLTPLGDLHTVIFAFIAIPLQTLGTSFTAMVIAVVVANVLWIFGIHGGLIIYTVFIGLWAPIAVENLAAYNNNLPIPHIVSGALFVESVSMGAGQTLGLSIAMLFGKSKQYRTLGKLAVVPNACGINEPIIFATPIVMNLSLAFPFVLVPTLSVFAAYYGMVLGILPPLPGINAPLGTPVIISGLLASGGSWKWAVFQVLTIMLSFAIYRPFFRKIDRIAFDREQTGDSV